VKIAYQPYKWLIVIPFVFLTTMILGVICIFTSLLFKQDAANTIAVIWAKLCCGIVPLRVRLKGRKNYDPNRAYVVVSNHQSMADIPVVHSSLGLNIKWVMKEELRRIPIFGISCQQLGCISINRKDHASAINSLNAAKRQLSKKASIFFFAEGTRSRDGQVMPFKKGAFKYAFDTGLPILPLTIKNSAARLPSDSLDLTPGTIDLIVHLPVYPSDYPVEQIDQVISDTREIIVQSLK
jgi:1-acyl-sn-glycerol-3-phosphate acyltransferase